jgi:hypothetical protein
MNIFINILGSFLSDEISTTSSPQVESKRRLKKNVY